MSMDLGLGNEAQNVVDIRLELGLECPTLTKVEFHVVHDVDHDLTGKEGHTGTDVPDDDAAAMEM